MGQGKDSAFGVCANSIRRSPASKFLGSSLLSLPNRNTKDACEAIEIIGDVSCQGYFASDRVVPMISHSFGYRCEPLTPKGSNGSRG